MDFRKINKLEKKIRKIRNFAKKWPFSWGVAFQNGTFDPPEGVRGGPGVKIGVRGVKIGVLGVKIGVLGVRGAILGGGTPKVPNLGKFGQKSQIRGPNGKINNKWTGGSKLLKIDSLARLIGKFENFGKKWSKPWGVAFQNGNFDPPEGVRRGSGGVRKGSGGSNSWFSGYLGV
jgi:hypothetical protein